MTIAYLIGGLAFFALAALFVGFVDRLMRSPS